MKTLASYTDNRNISLTWSEFEKISKFIYEKTGIHLEDKKDQKKLENFLNKNRKKLDIRSSGHFYKKLCSHDGKDNFFQDLINSVTINETYYFRENHHFETLKKYLLKELHKNLPKDKPIRILSAPCSTGEEPYSMAINIMEEGKVIKEREIEIVGIDINSEVIDGAKRALYSERSVQTVPPILLKQYFYKKNRKYRLSGKIAKRVKFTVSNIFNRIQLESLGKFDIIFSRNMMIYFDKMSRERAVSNLDKILNPGGYILFGHAEQTHDTLSIFEAQKFDQSIIYKGTSKNCNLQWYKISLDFFHNLNMDRKYSDCLRFFLKKCRTSHS